MNWLNYIILLLNMYLSNTSLDDLTVAFTKTSNSKRITPLNSPTPVSLLSPSIQNVESARKAFFHVTGMTCSSCVGKIEREMKKKMGT